MLTATQSIRDMVTTRADAVPGALHGDLRQHVHFDHDILFPRAIEMERALNQQG